ncbi:methylated-DNA--[protein]-cysteine S-methyltransferase [Clostridium brassicae]|uniref:Methylated-DNA--protein-cysteine methyltransferase n=1 Tax=Clostridium brassicae TaxID=2999072 RepID=A0ABT4D8N8_9CLOT|nr:methylated-DNA--[protein]-cysteine S-methyltransferase [Clostridium brassicae]MCY6958662.1 methylated-DNA--[protein]-cysteine S-methyltransferase [Clostridium brassicae]
MSKTYRVYYDSPIGIIEIKGTEEVILSIMYVDESKPNEENELLIKCCNELDEYFKGKRKDFTIKVSWNGTEFQNKLWNQLTKIPFGKTVTYKEIAQFIGNPKAVRAVGNANGKNILNILVPCHRVIGSNGSLTGYSGGIWRKEWLIRHEKNINDIN